MALKQVLFSFNGRINTATYWVYVLASIFLPIIASVCVNMFFDVGADSEYGNLLAAVLVIPTIILACYINLALHVKRLHDTNRSGWNYLWGFIPVFGEIYILSVCGFRKGIEEKNKYGSAPANGIAGF